jgi:uncharacterized protein YdcH (DUF465 family)
MALERELSLLGTRIHHFVEAVARREGTNAMIKKLKAEEERKRALVQELNSLDDMAKVVSLDSRQLAERL